MAFTDGFIRADSLVPSEHGYRVIVQLPWMRSLPLSSVVAMSFELDGDKAADDDLGFWFKGRLLPFRELAERWRDFWFIQERIAVDVRSSRHVLAGEVHRLTARASLRIPYILTPSGPMVIKPSTSQDLVVREAGS